MVHFSNRHTHTLQLTQYEINNFDNLNSPVLRKLNLQLETPQKEFLGPVFTGKFYCVHQGHPERGQTRREGEKLKEMARPVTDTEASLGLPSASWGSRKPSGITQSNSKNLRTERSVV